MSRAPSKARQQLHSFLLRNGLHYTGKTLWSVAHPAQQITLQEYIYAVRACVKE